MMKTEVVKINEDAELLCYLPDPEISFRTYRKRPALIICPGGAYMILATKEGEGAALEFLARGYACFVLRYTVATDRYHPEKGINKKAVYPRQVLELMKAMHVVHANREKWNLNGRIFLMGFSAGGHVCASAGTRWHDASLLQQLDFKPEEYELRADGMVLGYPMLADNPEDFQGKEYRSLDPEKLKIVNHALYGKDQPDAEDRKKTDLREYVNAETIPAFLWHCMDDPVVDPEITTSFVLKLQQNHVPCEYHLFTEGGHGKCLASPVYAKDESETDRHIAGWPVLADEWMQRMTGERL